MRRLSRFAKSVVTIGVAMSAAILPMSAGTAAAEPADQMDKHRVPLGNFYRACDFSVSYGSSLHSEGVAFALIDISGGTVTAEVSLTQGLPFTRYDARLIQAPRPASRPCNAGDPGVTAAPLQTDFAGNGAVTLTSAIESGAEGAWVFLTMPDRFAQKPAAYYTSGSIINFASG